MRSGAAWEPTSPGRVSLDGRVRKGVGEAGVAGEAGDGHRSRLPVAEEVGGGEAVAPGGVGGEEAGEGVEGVLEAFEGGTTGVN